MDFYVDPDITKAETLPASFYMDPEVFRALKEKVFLRTWQFAGDRNVILSSGNVCPFVMLPNFLNEPLVITQDENGNLNCLSNVCTHRGNCVVSEAGKIQSMVCRYHGRSFDLNGKFRHMPHFKQAKNFPSEKDHLPAFPVMQWGPMVFAGLDPVFSLGKVIAEMNQRIGFLPIDEFRYRPDLAKDFRIRAHWALYCDNYLEGLHIPFVHGGLDQILDSGTYTTEVFEYHNLQVGYVDDPGDAFDLPEGHPDSGKMVGAYYFWIFPNMMFNFYPWGLSINIVYPRKRDRTKVSFIPYVYDESRLRTGAGAELEQVELEDEEVVESVQRGVNSRFYTSGRFSPSKEQGVHHFHRLLSQFLSHK